MKDERNQSSQNEEIPKNIGSWILEQGVTIDNFEQKAADSLSNKKTIHKELGGISKEFTEFSDTRNSFLLAIAVFVIFLILQIADNVGLFPFPYLVRVIGAFISLVAFGLILKRIFQFLTLDKNTRTKLENMEDINGIGPNGEGSPDSFELLSQTFLPSLKNFMESFSSHSEQEHIKELLKNALSMYGLYNENIGNTLLKSKKIMYSENASLNYLIGNISKETGIDATLARLSYHDYVKDPVVKGELSAILSTQEFENTKERLIKLFTKSLPIEIKEHWKDIALEKIILEVLIRYTKDAKEYSFRNVKRDFADISDRANSNLNLFIANLESFRIIIDVKEVKNCGINDLTLESLENGGYFQKCVSKNLFKRMLDLEISHLNLIYHYRTPEPKRKQLLSELNDKSREVFAEFIYRRVLEIPKKIDSRTLGQILFFIGDFQLDKLGRKINSILELLEFLETARKTLEALEFEVKSEENPNEYLRGVSNRILGMTDEKWVVYYYDYFVALVDWCKELSRKFPETAKINIENLTKILFIIFSNGRLHFQPSLDKIELNRHYSSRNPDLELYLLKFVELFQKSSINDIPKIILDILNSALSESRPYYLDLFHREFVLGTIPTYDFLVWESSRGYLGESSMISIQASKEKDTYNLIRRIVDTVFSLKLNDEFIKSMLIGGAVSAYLIIKSSKGGRLITTLKFGTQLPRSSTHLRGFESFLFNYWKNVQKYGIPQELGPNDYYRVNFSGFAVILGIVPESMSFTDFSNSMDSLINAYFESLKNETSEMVKYERRAQEMVDKLQGSSWEILPLDISTVRKALDQREYHPLEKEYINTIGNFLMKDENTAKKMAWIGVIGSRGSSSAQHNLKEVIKNVIDQDQIGFIRYLELKESFFEILTAEGNTKQIRLIFDETNYILINSGILKALKSVSFVKACESLQDMSSNIKYRKDFLQSAIENLQLNINGNLVKFSVAGVEYLTKNIPLISRAIVLLTGNTRLWETPNELD